MALDPDIVVILDPSGNGSETLLEDWRRLSGLRAVKEGRVTAVSDRRVQSTGPSILDMVEKLRAAIVSAWRKQ